MDFRCGPVPSELNAERLSVLTQWNNCLRRDRRSIPNVNVWIWMFASLSFVIFRSIVNTVKKTRKITKVDVRVSVRHARHVFDPSSWLSNTLPWIFPDFVRRYFLQYHRCVHQLPHGPTVIKSEQVRSLRASFTERWLVQTYASHLAYAQLYDVFVPCWCAIDISYGSCMRHLGVSVKEANKLRTYNVALIFFKTLSYSILYVTIDYVFYSCVVFYPAFGCQTNKIRVYAS